MGREIFLYYLVGENKGQLDSTGGGERWSSSGLPGAVRGSRQYEKQRKTVGLAVERESIYPSAFSRWCHADVMWPAVYFSK